MVNLRQAENVSFFHCLARCTLSHTSTDRMHTHAREHTLRGEHKNTYATPRPPPVRVGGGRKVGETNISLERD